MLYIVATPIGNLEDITLRALRVLKECDVIFCEDTRVSQKLLVHYGIDKPLLTYHEHNAAIMRPKILEKLASGQKITLISDAGTPLISDPGFKLIRACQEQALPYTVIPGPSSVIAGLVLSAMPTDQFTFCGFADPKKFQALQAISGTLIFFESAQRLEKTLTAMDQAFQGRRVCVVREITKTFEEAIFGTFPETISHFQSHPPRGEIVVVLSPSDLSVDLGIVTQDLKKALETMSLKDASDFVAKSHGINKKQVYQQALKIKDTK
jgi:16S rRNA (cytidine1402-2'-O)-methyltransferase